MAPKLWLNQGGRATHDAYSIYHPDLMLKHEKEFFNKQDYYYTDDKNRVFCHGGYTSQKGVGHEPIMANYYWDRELWSIALSGEATLRGGHAIDQRSPRRLRPHKEIFIGHTSTTNWGKDTPMNACNVWNLDTGAGYDGKLTIMDVDTKEYWQSDKVMDLYPNERGRN